MKQTMNYPSDRKGDPRLKIYINRDAEKCLQDLSNVIKTRDGKPMRYTSIVNLALFNLASQMDVDLLPHVSLLATAFRDIDENLLALDDLRLKCAEQIINDPDIQDVLSALECAHRLCEACQAEVQRQALASCGNEATLPPEEDWED